MIRNILTIVTLTLADHRFHSAYSDRLHFSDVESLTADSPSDAVTVVSDRGQSSRSHHATQVPTIDPDSGEAINWTALDLIVDSYTPSPQTEWLPPPTSKCHCDHLQYRPLYCVWYIKPFRNPFDFVVTETKKWPTSRKLLGCHGNRSDSTSEDDGEDMLNGPRHTGLPMLAYFGTECCRVYANATQAYLALSAFDTCWYNKDELKRCFEDGHYVPVEETNLTVEQHSALMRNATYADLATPHL